MDMGAVALKLVRSSFFIYFYKKITARPRKSLTVGVNLMYAQKH